MMKHLNLKNNIEFDWNVCSCYTKLSCMSDIHGFCNEMTFITFLALERLGFLFYKPEEALITISYIFLS